MSCANCQSKSLKWACDGQCGYAYCSKSCADTHWKNDVHLLHCGAGELADVPKDVLEMIMLRVPVLEFRGICRSNNRAATICKLERFQKAYVAARPLEEWTNAIVSWFRNSNSPALRKWLPLLLSQNILDPTAKLYAERTSLYLMIASAGEGDADLIRLLLEDGRCDPSMKHNSPFLFACWSGNIDAVTLLMNDERVDVDDAVPIMLGQHNVNAIDAAILGNRPEVLRLLLRDGRCDPAEDNNVALLDACKRGLYECAKILLADRRVNPVLPDPDDDVEDRFPWLIKACKRGHVQIVRLLLDDARVQSWLMEGYFANNDDVVILAIENDHPDVLEVLLGSLAVSCNDAHNLPMKVACGENHPECVRVLLREPYFHLTNPFVENLIEPGETAFSHAIAHGNVRVVQLLLEEPRNPIDSREFYRVVCAYGRKHVEGLALLLTDSRFDPSFDNQLALREAAKRGLVQIVELLIDDPRVGTPEGLQLALEQAQQSNHADTVKLIQSKQRVLNQATRKQRRLVQAGIRK